MNAQSHRLIFNAARGCVMAVSETSRSCTKTGVSSVTPSKHRKRLSTRGCKPNWPLANGSIAQPAINTVANIVSGNLTIQGSNVSAGQTTTLAADNKIQLLAAASTATQTSDQKSSSSSAGISLGQQTGVTVSASQGSGDGNGQDLRYTNTQITGKAVTIQSGGDTIVKGAVAKADTVTATIGGNLQIESLQDKSNYTDQSKNTDGSATLGPAPGASINLGKSNIDSTYASVSEQSGIRAGDGGFNVNVQGNTVLKAGAITSTQKAIDDNKDSFTTGGTITTSDIKNSADFKAEAAQISVGVGSSAGGSAGIGNNEGSASSTTHAAISGVAGNKNARTGDAQTGIAKIFDADKVRKDINAQVAITKEFGQQATAAVQTYGQNQRKALLELADKATTDAQKQEVQKQLKDLATQEKVLNVLVGAVAGLGGMALTKEGLATAADQMRELMVADSQKFAGVVDSGGKTLSNASGKSEGANGDGFKLGGTRVDLDLLCGASNERCATQKNSDGSSVLGANGIPMLALSDKGQVLFEGKDANNNPISIDDFLKTDQGKKMSGATGGNQGAAGTLFGVPYAAGSWQDKLIEAFAGTHDFVGGKLSGLYDEQGNATRGRSTLTTTLQNHWSELAILPSTPFAAAQTLPPEVWKAIAIFLKAAR